MHALHLPPRHIWRVTLIAALLALVFTALLVVPAGELGSGRGSDVGAERQAVAGPSAAATSPRGGHRADKPAWITDPTAPPTFTLPADR